RHSISYGDLISYVCPPISPHHPVCRPGDAGPAAAPSVRCGAGRGAGWRVARRTAPQGARPCTARRAPTRVMTVILAAAVLLGVRSEERRVGMEGGERWVAV